MSTIWQNYELNKNKPSDINQHLETLKNYSSGCTHITEVGVRGIVSTWALLAGKPKIFKCYDISNLNTSVAKKAAEEEGIDFQFINADVLNVSIENTDLLFIDTLHRYLQLKKELQLHAPKTKRYIILHDTTTYGNVDEPIYQPECQLKNVTSEKQGLLPAIDEFLCTEEGKKWEMHKIYVNNNGLTILRRTCD